MEEKEIDVKKKSNKKVIIIVSSIVLVLCIVLLVLFVFNSSGGHGENNDNNTEENSSGTPGKRKVEFDTNLYYIFHLNEGKATIKEGFEDFVYSKEEVYAKDFTSLALFDIIHKNSEQERSTYTAKEGGVKLDENGQVSDPGYELLIDYEPMNKFFKEFVYKLVGDNLEYSDDLLTTYDSDGSPVGFKYEVIEENGKKYYKYTSRTGYNYNDVYYEYKYEKIDYGDDEAYLYENVSVYNNGEYNPKEEYVYKWTYKLGTDNEYHLYSIIRE